MKTSMAIVLHFTSEKRYPLASWILGLLVKSLHWRSLNMKHNSREGLKSYKCQHEVSYALHSDFTREVIFFVLVKNNKKKEMKVQISHPPPHPCSQHGSECPKDVLMLKVPTISTHSQSQMLAGSRNCHVWVTSLQPCTLLRGPGVNGIFEDKAAFSD